MILAYGPDCVPLKENRVRRSSPTRATAEHAPAVLRFRSSLAHEFYFLLLLLPRPWEPLQIAVSQSISGTGALRVGAAFLARHYPHSKAVYMPAPTWGNHIPTAKDSGLEVKTYSYYDKKTVGLDFDGFKADLRVRSPLSPSPRGLCYQF